MSVGKKQPVICVDTGEVFASQRAAARSLGVTVTAINHVIAGRSTLVRGKGFRYANGDEIHEWQKSQPKRLDREEWRAIALELGKTLVTAFASPEVLTSDERSSLDTLILSSLEKLEGVV
jgi:hypothetical protein